MASEDSSPILGMFFNEMAPSQAESEGLGANGGAPLSGEQVFGTPVLCHRVSARNVVVPAVRFSHESGIGVFPLTKVELGDVWHVPAQLGAWQINELMGGWDELRQACIQHLTYPSVFWEELIRVLRAARFTDGSMLGWSQWGEACRYPNPHLFVPRSCTACNQPLQIPMRWIHDSALDVMRAKCGDLGRQCITAPLALPAPPNQGAPNYALTASALSDVVGQQSSPPPPASNPMVTSPVPSVRPRLGEDGVEEVERKTWGQLRAELASSNREEEQRWVEERELDPFAAIHPDPMNYVVGTPVTRFLAPDPTAADIAQYHQLRKGGKVAGSVAGIFEVGYLFTGCPIRGRKRCG